MWYDVWYHSWCCDCIRFVSDAGILDQVDDPLAQEHAASNSESERSMDSIEARDYADQNNESDDEGKDPPGELT